MADESNKFPSQADIDKIKMFYRNNYVNRRVAINCLFHPDQNKSLKVYGNRFNCLGCNKSGTTASLIIKIDKFTGDY